MKTVEYADQEIDGKELAFIIASMMIGIGVLTLPRLVATHTKGLDGLVSILFSGSFFLFFGWLLAKSISKFPKKSFFEYTSDMMTKPVALGLTSILALAFLFTCALETRVIANISKLYMFDQTPIEAIALTFLLVVVYCVSGSRVALLRLNLMFLPIVLTVTLIVQFSNISLFQLSNIQPSFTTSLNGYWQGAQETTFSFIGYTVILVYISLLKSPKVAPRMTMVGIGIPILLYLVIYTITIGVFGNLATSEIIYPTIEIAKEIEAPGGFIERFESIFFTVWIMTVFNTCSMAFDISIHLLHSITKLKRKTIILILSPLIYFVAVTPENAYQIQLLGKILAGIGFFYGVIFPVIFFSLTKIRKVIQHA
ncbi:GerAB/ArcD/ProY family transporter [Metabacillus endolithicus]|uniref:Endospore germination permease n=1 Tax=Metabacillus endolithicus TaxID=1535204 RepID=A0ABW5BQY8_9BACI|nr:endospore germination permease [Metabacillus endolithicus]UPG63543.1 spore germination protein [Metabacillus endolithicus]